MLVLNCTVAVQIPETDGIKCCLTTIRFSTPMRYRKGRHPTTVNPHGIPTDVVDVQMGAHDRFTLAVSTDRRNTLAKTFGWCLEV